MSPWREALDQPAILAFTGHGRYNKVRTVAKLPGPESRSRLVLTCCRRRISPEHAAKFLPRSQPQHRDRSLRVCAKCESLGVAQDWRCPECDFSPPRIDGFFSFAPDLAASNDGMAPDSHDHLDVLQDQSFWFRARNRLIKDFVGSYFPSARRVLELGCGTGYVTQALVEALPHAEISASEIYTNGLTRAACRVGPTVELLQLDARQIPFRREFDLICAFDVLEHIDDDCAVLEQMASALAPGGGTLLSVPQHPFLWSHLDVYSHHKRRYRSAELATKCRRAGLTVIRTTSFVTSLLPFMAIKRLAERGEQHLDATVEHRLPRFVDRALEAALETERRLIRTGASLPIGGSRFVVARGGA